jgi:hypothetical protein
MTKGFERFCATSSNKAQTALAAAVAKLTKNGLEDGFEIEDIIDYLTFMVESEAEVAKDVHDETYWSEGINQGLGLDNLNRRFQ